VAQGWKGSVAAGLRQVQGAMREAVKFVNFASASPRAPQVDRRVHPRRVGVTHV